MLGSVAATAASAVYLAAGKLSLMHGWVPVTVQVLTGVTLIRVIRWRSRRWRALWLPVTGMFGALTAVVAHWYFGHSGIASEPAPWQLWLSIALTGLAVGIAVAGWPGCQWSQRNQSVFVVWLCLISIGLVINGWLGYYPTAYAAWNQVTAGALPDQTDWATVTAMRSRDTQPSTGAVLPVTIRAAASNFSHREELVYLPPAWFRSVPPPRLPAVMMIGGEFNTPADWVRAGDAISTLDAFAASHGGTAPVAVFVDSIGAFTNDTECVNGPRGNAADHLIKDVIPYVVATFGVGADKANWGVVGFSTGGTCAVDLTVRNPDRFSAFIDIAGDLGPNAGTKAQTIDRLFGGNAEAWSAFDPASVITTHATYTTVSGLFVVPVVSGRAGPLGAPANRYQIAGNTLCALGRAHGINCRVVALQGRHVWPFAGTTFAMTLPWLARQLHAAA